MPLAWLSQLPQLLYEDGDPVRRQVTSSNHDSDGTSDMNRSACFNSSPMISTLDVVPSPVISSWRCIIDHTH